MFFDTHALIQCRRLYSDGRAASASGDQSHQALELRFYEFSRLLVAGPPPKLVTESPPIQLNNNALLRLSLRQLQHPLFYVTQFLSSFNIRGAAGEAISRQIASYIVRMAAGNRERNFHIVAVIDCIVVLTYLYPVKDMEILENAPPARRRATPPKLEEEELGEEEESEDCSICLDEIDSKKKKVIKIPCGHAYHQSCIFKWLNGNNSCPLCRMPLPLED